MPIWSMGVMGNPVDQIDCEMEFFRSSFQKINVFIVEKSFIDCLVCTG